MQQKPIHSLGETHSGDLISGFFQVGPIGNDKHIPAHRVSNHTRPGPFLSDLSKMPLLILSSPTILTPPPQPRPPSLLVASCGAPTESHSLTSLSHKGRRRRRRGHCQCRRRRDNRRSQPTTLKKSTTEKLTSKTLGLTSKTLV